MRELLTVVLFFVFMTMCALLFFAKNSRTYEKAARMPLDEDELDKPSDKTNEE